MDEFKDCKNCLHLKEEISKFYCKKNHFVKVDKQKFFYNPDGISVREPLFLTKYETLSHAIECKDYSCIAYKEIIDVEFTETRTEGAKYGDIEIVVQPTGNSFSRRKIRYANVSPGAKIRKYFEKAKRWIDANKRDAAGRETDQVVQEL
jgi:hypothetical protein